MSRHLVPAALIGLLLVVQAQLWFGRGSVGNVAQLSHDLTAQQQANTQAQLENERLQAEIQDLK